MIDEEEFAQAMKLVDPEERSTLVRELAARINKNRKDSQQRLADLDEATYKDILGGDDILPFLEDGKDEEG